MNYSYEQIGNVCATFACYDSVKPGQVCQILYNDTIYTAEEDSLFDGVVLSRRGDCACVAVRGFVTVTYSGVAPYLGSCYLVSDDEGHVHRADSGKLCTVVHIDEVNQTVTFLM